MLEKLKPYHDQYNLSWIDPEQNVAIEIRFDQLTSINGFRRLSEVSMVIFNRQYQDDSRIQALKQSFEPGSYGPCALSDTHSEGKVHSRGKSAEWKITLTPQEFIPFELIPQELNRAKLFSCTSQVLQNRLKISGTVTFGGKTYTFQNASGLLKRNLGHHFPKKSLTVSGGFFQDERGQNVDFDFIGAVVMPSWLNLFTLPRHCSFYLRYRDQEIRLNTVWNSLWSQSELSSTTWSFHAETGELSFRGSATAENKDLAGLSFEDTQGTMLYALSSKLADLEVRIFRHSRLESAFYSKGFASWEWTSPSKSPYVPVLI